MKSRYKRNLERVYKRLFVNYIRFADTVLILTENRSSKVLKLEGEVNIDFIRLQQSIRALAESVTAIEEI